MLSIKTKSNILANLRTNEICRGHNGLSFQEKYC